MQTNIILYVLYFDKVKLKYKILSQDPSVLIAPSHKIENTNSSIDEILDSIINKYINVSPQYIECKLSDVEIKQNEINIYYYCLVPFLVEHKLFSIDISLNEIYPKNLYKIIRNL